MQADIEQELNRVREAFRVMSSECYRLRAALTGVPEILDIAVARFQKDDPDRSRISVKSREIRVVMGEIDE